MDRLTIRNEHLKYKINNVGNKYRVENTIAKISHSLDCLEMRMISYLHRYVFQIGKMLRVNDTLLYLLCTLYILLVPVCVRTLEP